MSNFDLRQHAKDSGIPLWQLADFLQCSEATVTRKLRHELPESEKAALYVAIDSLKEKAV